MSPRIFAKWGSECPLRSGHVVSLHEPSQLHKAKAKWAVAYGGAFGGEVAAGGAKHSAFRLRPVKPSSVVWCLGLKSRRNCIQAKAHVSLGCAHVCLQQHNLYNDLETCCGERPVPTVVTRLRHLVPVSEPAFCSCPKTVATRTAMAGDAQSLINCWKSNPSARCQKELLLTGPLIESHEVFYDIARFADF
jgi:hypothetical protein